MSSGRLVDEASRRRASRKDRVEQLEELPQRPSRRALILFTTQFAVMFNAGIPVTRLFDSLVRTEDQKLSELADYVRRFIHRGRYLSQALARLPHIFPSQYVLMVRVGEKNGTLHRVLRLLSAKLVREDERRQRLISALTYPAVVAVVSVSIFALFLFYVAPDVLPMFTEFGLETPWPTRMLIKLQKALLSPQRIVFAALVLVALGFMFHRFATGESKTWLRQKLDEAWLRAPLIGRMNRLSIATSLLDALSTMLEAGLAIDACLRTCLTVTHNAVVTEELKRALVEVTEGRTIASGLSQVSVFPPLALTFVARGEEAGHLPELMGRAAALMDEELQLQIDTLISLVEPMVMLMVGLGVGLIVYMCFLPLLSLTQNLM